jgi:hypothetical protein
VDWVEYGLTTSRLDPSLTDTRFAYKRLGLYLDQENDVDNLLNPIASPDKEKRENFNASTGSIPDAVSFQELCRHASEHKIAQSGFSSVYKVYAPDPDPFAISCDEHESSPVVSWHMVGGSVNKKSLDNQITRMINACAEKHIEKRQTELRLSQYLLTDKIKYETMGSEIGDEAVRLMTFDQESVRDQAVFKAALEYQLRETLKSSPSRSDDLEVLRSGVSPSRLRPNQVWTYECARLY